MTDRIIRIKLDSRQAEQGINRLDDDMRGLGRTSDGIQTKLTAVASALAAAFSVQQIAAYADAYTNIQNRLRVVTDSTEQLTRVTASLLQTANDTRASFDATSSLYSTLARSTEELAISEERLIAITKTVNQSFAVSGASADEAANAIRQLSQGLAAGALRGDEFNSVAEQAPGILRAVANETGKTVGQLREFAAQGGITAELLISAIENYADVVETEFNKTNRTFQQSTVVAQNNATAFVGSSKIVQEATQAAGNALVNLTENLDTVALALTTITAVIAGRYGAALVAAAVNTARVTAANLAAKTTYDALGLAVTRTTVAQNASVAASRASAAAFALIGGPVGAAILAAGGLAYFVVQAISSQREAERLANAARGLNSELEKTNKIYENYQKTQQSAAEQALTGLGQAELQAQFSKSSALVEIYKKRINDLKEAGASYARIADVEEKLKKEQLTLDAINKTSPQTAKGTQDLALRLGDLAAQVNLTSIEYSVFAERQRLIKDGFSTNEIDKYIESYRALLLLQEEGRAKAKTGSDIDSLFSGSDNLFSGSAPDDSGQNEESANRINERIAALKLETQTLGSELTLQQGIRQGFISQEQAQLDLQTANKIQNAITERELLLAEKTITKEQEMAAEMAFTENMLAIALTYEEGKTAIAQQEAFARMELDQQVRDANVQSFQSGVSLLQTFLGQSNAIVKAARLAMGAYQAFSIYASSSAAAAAALAPPPLGLGPIAGAPLAGKIALAGKLSAAAVAASAAASTFSGGGGSFGGGGSGGGASAGALPTTPQSAPTVQTLEIRGLDEIRDELRNQDGMVSTRFVATILDKISDANRIRGEG